MRQREASLLPQPSAHHVMDVDGGEAPPPGSIQPDRAPPWVAGETPAAKGRGPSGDRDVWLGPRYGKGRGWNPARLTPRD